MRFSKKSGASLNQNKCGVFLVVDNRRFFVRMTIAVLSVVCYFTMHQTNPRTSKTFKLECVMNEDQDGNSRKKSYPVPSHKLQEKYKDVEFAAVPSFGTHQPYCDAVMTFAVGYSVEKIILFIESLRSTGFKGDIVIGTGVDSDNKTRIFFKEYASLWRMVVYEIPLACDKFRGCNVVDMYRTKQSSNNSDMSHWQLLEDSRQQRIPAIIRYEYYYEWTALYHYSSRILLTDSRDVYFQRNPFEMLTSCMPTTLFVFESGLSKNKPNQSMTIEESLPDYNWIKNAYAGTNTIGEVMNKTSYCSGTTLGGQAAVEMYTRAMVDQYDYSFSLIHGSKNFDQAYHNVLIHKGLLSNATNITNLMMMEVTFPNNIVRTMGQEIKYIHHRQSLHQISWFQNKSGEELVMNLDGSVPAVVHQADRHKELANMMRTRAHNSLALLGYSPLT